MTLQDWKAESQKRLEKRMQAQANEPKGSPNFRRYLANFRAALANRNYEYGTTKLLADTSRISPVYNPHGKAVSRWCVFGADGWELEQSNNL